MSRENQLRLGFSNLSQSLVFFLAKFESLFIPDSSKEVLNRVEKACCIYLAWYLFLGCMEKPLNTPIQII